MEQEEENGWFEKMREIPCGSPSLDKQGVNQSLVKVGQTKGAKM